ncbi:MAG: restriction endonuclease, partial [Thiohalomonadales bacterium]
MSESPLNSAIRHFEAAEANLIKLEKLWDEIEGTIPDGVAFVDSDPLYEDNCRSFDDILAAIPAIDGWKPEISLFELNEIG